MGLLANGDNKDKPIFRKWARDAEDHGKEDEDIFDYILEVKLSKSEEWLILEGAETKAFIHAQSKVGKAFWEIVSALDGIGKALKLVPVGGKLGFDIEVAEEILGYWEYDKFDESVTCDLEGMTKRKKPVGFSFTAEYIMAVHNTDPDSEPKPKSKAK